MTQLIAAALCLGFAGGIALAFIATAQPIVTDRLETLEQAQ